MRDMDFHREQFYKSPCFCQLDPQNFGHVHQKGRYRQARTIVPLESTPTNDTAYTEPVLQFQLCLRCSQGYFGTREWCSDLCAQTWFASFNAGGEVRVRLQQLGLAESPGTRILKRNMRRDEGFKKGCFQALLLEQIVTQRRWRSCTLDDVTSITPSPKSRHYVQMCLCVFKKRGFLRRVTRRHVRDGLWRVTAKGRALYPEEAVASSPPQPAYPAQSVQESV